MKFYDRIDELALLTRTEELAQTTAQMTFVVGRRRIGKTSLLIKATENSKGLYFQLKKSSKLLYQYKDYQVNYRGFSIDDM